MTAKEIMERLNKSFSPQELTEIMDVNGFMVFSEPGGTKWLGLRTTENLQENYSSSEKSGKKEITGAHGAGKE